MSRRLATVLLAPLLLLLFAAASTQAATPLAGREIAPVLAELRQAGLPLVWSDQVISGLVILAEPTSKRPRRLLAEILAPHRLELVDGPGGRLLVAPKGSSDPAAAGLAELTGVVVDEQGATVPGLRVRLEGSRETIALDNRGRFEFRFAPVGKVTVQVLDGGRVLAAHEITVRGEEQTDIVIEIKSLPIPLEQIEVVSHLSILEDEPTAGLSLDRDSIQALPHFGDDPLRVVKDLPGVSAGDLTTDVQLRGALADELLYRLDGLELYEPFHLRDLNGLFSFVDPQLVAGIDLIPGNFPAEYGDRSAGVLDMRTLVRDDQHGSAGISFSNAWLGGGRTFDHDRGRFLASARRGYLDLVLDLAREDDEEDDPAPQPEYWDTFLKLDYQVSARNHMAVNALVAGDDIEFHEREDRDLVNVDTVFTDRYVWLRHQGVVSSRGMSDSVFSVAAVDHDRVATGRDFDRNGVVGEAFDLDDDRRVELAGLRQDWSFELGASRSHLLKAGFEARVFDVDYRYRDSVLLEDPIDDPRFAEPFDVTRVTARFEGDHWSLYAADRLRLGKRLVVEAGVRYDRQTLTDSDQVSPRLNLLVPLGRAGTLRAGWGHFFQSQKPHELDVQYGVEAFQPAQRNRHTTVGWERQFDLGLLRVEAFDRRVEDPPFRFETLFDPFRALPQFATDVVRIAPVRAESRGIELYASARSQRPLSWFASLVWSETFDVLADGVHQPRFYDQRWATTASLTWRPGPRWTLASVVRYHTGWPTTRLAATSDFSSGQRVVTYDVGPFYGERLPAYSSLDLRLSRRSVLRRGTLTLFLDVQNLLDRENPRGLDIEDVRSFDCQLGRCRVGFDDQTWLGRLPSLGVSWEF